MSVGSSLLRVCADERCRSVIEDEDAICYECGGTDFREATAGQALLSAVMRDRQIGFIVDGAAENAIGRSDGSAGGLQVDLARFAAADSVHHRHATLRLGDSGWEVTHKGRNALVIQRAGESLPIEPGQSSILQPGDTLMVGLVALRFVAR